MKRKRVAYAENLRYLSFFWNVKPSPSFDRSFQVLRSPPFVMRPKSQSTRLTDVPVGFVRGFDRLSLNGMGYDEGLNHWALMHCACGEEKTESLTLAVRAYAALEAPGVAADEVQWAIGAKAAREAKQLACCRSPWAKS
jgi:hypothetical protein